MDRERRVGRVLKVRRRCAAAAVTLGAAGAGACAAVAATPGYAAASAAALKSTFSAAVVIGPLRAAHGFTVQLELDSCGTSRGRLIVSYEAGNDLAALDHVYTGPARHCSVTSTLSVTTVQVHWGKILALNLRLPSSGPLQREDLGSPGCHSGFVESRPATSTGSGTLAIHAAALGDIHFRSAAATVLAEGARGCVSTSGGSTLPMIGAATEFGRRTPRLSRGALAAAAAVAAAAVAAPQNGTAQPAMPTWTSQTATSPTGPEQRPTVPATTTAAPVTTTTTPAAAAAAVTPDGSGTRFYSTFGASGLLRIQASIESPFPPLILITDRGADSPIRGVTSDLAVALEGADVFSANAPADRAELAASGAYARGELTFTATQVCASTSDVVQGRLSGVIVVSDPVLGKLRYAGASAHGAAMGNLDANVTRC